MGMQGIVGVLQWVRYDNGTGGFVRGMRGVEYPPQQGAVGKRE